LKKTGQTFNPPLAVSKTWEKPQKTHKLKPCEKKKKKKPGRKKKQNVPNIETEWVWVSKSQTKKIGGEGFERHKKPKEQGNMTERDGSRDPKKTRGRNDQKEKKQAKKSN